MSETKGMSGIASFLFANIWFLFIRTEIKEMLLDMWATHFIWTLLWNDLHVKIFEENLQFQNIFSAFMKIDHHKIY